MRNSSMGRAPGADGADRALAARLQTVCLVDVCAMGGFGVTLRIQVWLTQFYAIDMYHGKSIAHPG